MNIKNERTHALVRELAALTGTTLTGAVEDAVLRRLDELRDPARSSTRYSGAEIARRDAAIQRISESFIAETTPEQRAAMREHGDLLYDDLGLPK